MMELPEGLTARVKQTTAQQVTYELTVDLPAYRTYVQEQAVYQWVRDMDLGGQVLTQLVCRTCEIVLVVVGPAAPSRWICACGQEQAVSA